MKYRLVLLVIYIIMSMTSGFAQKTITGEVIGKNKEAIEMFNVIIRNPTDSALIKGGTFWDGNFTIEGIRKDSIWLCVSRLGYKDRIIPVNINGYRDVVDLDTLHLVVKNIKMDRVVVRGKRNIFSLQDNKLVMNVNHTSLENAGTVKELLRKSAQIIVDKENTIKVFGKGKAKVLVDGREMATGRALSSISSQNVKQIELITNPQADYSAEGNAIINIILKDKQRRGINARIYSRSSFGEFYRNYSSFETNYKDSSLKVSVYYSYSPEKKKFTDVHKRIFSSGLTIKNKVTKIRNFDQDHFGRMSGDYKINSRNRIGLQFRGFFEGHDVNYTNTNTLQPVSGSSSFIKSENKAFVEYKSPTVNLNYTFQVDTSGEKLELYLDRSWYFAEKKDKIEGTSGKEVFHYRNERNNRIDLTTFKMDYHYPLFEDLLLKGGIKTKFTRNSSKHRFFRKTNNEWNKDEGNSQTFTYKEPVLAGYFIAEKNVGNVSIKTGLRAEHSKRHGAQSNREKAIIDTSYLDFFPSISLEYQFSDDLKSNLSYSKRINRPNYKDLNPYTIYYDSLSYIKGNPNLVPEISHSVELKLIYKKYASLSLGYTRANNPVFMTIEKKNPNSLITYGVKKNIDYSDAYTASIVAPYRTENWTTYNSVGIRYRENKYDGNGRTFFISRPMWYFSSYHNLDLPMGISLHGTLNYYTGGVNGIYEFQRKYTVDAGIKKTFMDNKLSLSMDWNDIFNTDTDKSSTNVQGLYMEHKGFYDRSYISLKIAYKFSNYKDIFRSRSVSKEERNRINKNYE